jgi:hypothetical protein
MAAIVPLKTSDRTIPCWIPLHHGVTNRVCGDSRDRMLASTRRERSEWLRRCQDEHTTVAIATQATFGYVQNTVQRALTPEQPLLLHSRNDEDPNGPRPC